MYLEWFCEICEYTTLILTLCKNNMSIGLWFRSATQYTRQQLRKYVWLQHKPSKVLQVVIVIAVGWLFSETDKVVINGQITGQYLSNLCITNKINK